MDTHTRARERSTRGANICGHTFSKYFDAVRGGRVGNSKIKFTSFLLN